MKKIEMLIKRFMKTIAALAAVAVMTVSAGVPSGIDAAAADTSVKLSVPQSVSKGDSFKVTVTFSSSVNIGSVKARIDYNSNVVEFVSGEFANGGGGLCIINGWSETVGKTSTFELTFKAVGNGSSQIELEQASVYSDIGDLIGSPETAASSITVKYPNATAQTTSVTTKAPEQTSEATTTTTQEITEQMTVTTTPVETSASPVYSNDESSEQIAEIVTEPDAEEASEEDISDASDGETDDVSSEDESSEDEASDNKGPITAILLIVGCIAIACIIMSGDGNKKRSSRSRRK